MKQMYVYILQCNDKSYYTGVTNDLDRRLSEHNAGLNIGCYTYSRRPVKVEFYEIFNSPASAIAFEKKVKGWSKAKKKALIDKNWEKLQALAKCRNETSHENFKKGFDSAQPDGESVKKGFDSAQPDKGSVKKGFDFAQPDKVGSEKGFDSAQPDKWGLEKGFDSAQPD